MKLLDKLKDAITDRLVEAVAASLTVMLAWVAYQVAPVILPAIEVAIPKRVLLALLVASLVLNAAILVILWCTSRDESLRLRYGVYWDKQKNPHCPSCKKPLSAYAEYQMSGKGYRCIPCEKIVPLSDAHGNDVDPEKALREL